MKHQPGKKRRDRTAADHRPMIPLFRGPADPQEEELRSRCSGHLYDLREYLKWR